MHIATWTFLFTVFGLSLAYADEPNFKEMENGDLEARVGEITRSNLATLRRDIPGDQGRCVEIMILDFQDFGQTDAIMRIPAERHGIEFEPGADGVVRIICGRFTEEHYSSDGKPESALEYSVMEGY